VQLSQKCIIFTFSEPLRSLLRKIPGKKFAFTGFCIHFVHIFVVQYSIVSHLKENASPKIRAKNQKKQMFF